MGAESQEVESGVEWRGGLTHKILQYVTTDEGDPAGSRLLNGGGVVEPHGSREIGQPSRISPFQKEDDGPFQWRPERKGLRNHRISDSLIVLTFDRPHVVDGHH